MNNRKAKERRRQEQADAEYSAEAALAERRRRTRKAAAGGVAAFVAVAAIAVGIVSIGGGDSGSSAAAVAVDTAGLAPQYVANAKDANRVVDGSISAKLEELKGVPVVVNQWASWCPNCKSEFGYFADLAEGYRGQVAFVGLDSQDSRGDAEDFLNDHPIPFPSIFDKDASEAASIGAGQSWPTTVFYNAKGERTHIRPGGYTTAESLNADIQKYALGAGT